MPPFSHGARPKQHAEHPEMARRAAKVEPICGPAGLIALIGLGIDHTPPASIAGSPARASENDQHEHD